MFAILPEKQHFETNCIVAIILDIRAILIALMHRWYIGTYYMSLNYIPMRIFELMLFWLLYSISKNQLKWYEGFESKSFPDFSPNTMDLIAYIFRKHEIKCTSLGDRKLGYWTTFNEVLELPKGVLVRFRLPKVVSRKVSWIHPETGFDFTIDVGPESAENRAFILEIKCIVDELEDR